MWGQQFDGFEIDDPEIFFRFNDDIVQLAFGLHHGLALNSRGHVYSWGDGTFGELGSNESLFLEKPWFISYFKRANI